MEIPHGIATGLLRRPKWLVTSHNSELVLSDEGDSLQGSTLTDETWHTRESSTLGSLLRSLTSLIRRGQVVIHGSITKVGGCTIGEMTGAPEY